MCYALKHHQLAITKALVEECGCSLEMRTHVRLECESPTAYVHGNGADWGMCTIWRIQKFH